MSIYCSIFDFGFDHSTRCKRVRKVGRKEYEQDDSKPCTCGSSPLEYQGSHVLPSKKDKRGGVIGIAAIPGHIKRPGRKAVSDDMHPYHPWLRLSLDDAHQNAVILTRKQVEKLRDALNTWLEIAVGGAGEGDR